MKNVLAVLGRKHRPDARALSAYLDRVVSTEEAAAIEAHVATCAACARELAGLQAVRGLLSSLPQADLPRSFHLRPADVASAARPQAPVAMRLMPALSAAAAIAFAVLVGVSLSGIGAHHTSTSSPDAARILAAGASSTDTSAPAAAASGARSTAPIRTAPAAPAATGAQIPAATPGANDLQAQPAAPVMNPDQGAGASTGTSATTPASNPMTDAANGAAKAVGMPSVASEGRAPAGGESTAAAHSPASSEGRTWLLWAAIAAAVVAIASGAVSVRTWVRRRR